MKNLDANGKRKLLVVEDDANLGFLLQENLQLQGFDATLCTDGEEGKIAFLRGRFDLCLIDVMMPKKDGFTLAQELRRVDSQTPIIFLTAKSLKEDRIEGFKIGADDYVTKPFSMEELVLRIRAVLKRSSPKSMQPRDKAFQIGRYEFHHDRQLLILGDLETRLTFKESELLRLLCMHQNQLLERETALNMIWGASSFFNARSMDVFVSKLRKYLNADNDIEIVNIHGRGFKLLVHRGP